MGPGAFWGQVVWAIEDCRHLSARLERDLLTAGQQVVQVPRVDGSDPGLGTYRANPIRLMLWRWPGVYLREPDLPVASTMRCREPKLLVDRREVLVAQRTATINRLLWRVHELDPTRAPKARSMDLAKHQGTLADWLATQSGLVAELARDELADIIRLTEAIKALGTRIGERVREAARAAGDARLWGADRGQARRRVRRHHPVQKRRLRPPRGVAPIPVWSGNTAGGSG